MKKITWLIVVIFSFALNSFSQIAEKSLSLEDAVLGYYKGLYPESLRALQWIENTDNYIYMDGDSYIIKDASGVEVSKLILSDFTGDNLEIKRLPYLEKINQSEVVFQTPATYHVFDYNIKATTSTITFDEKGQNQDFCYKNKTLAYTIDNNLYIATDSNPKIKVTAISDKNIVSGQAIHRYEFGISKGTFWSPNGAFLAFYQKDETNVTDYPLVDVTTYPATLTNSKYPMAGQKSEQAKVGVFDVKSKELIYLDIDTSDEHYLTNLSWSPDEKYVLLAEVNREQNHMWFTIYDAKTGKKQQTLFEEKNDKWVEPETPALFLPNSNTAFLWLSERDGFMNIYQYNLQNNTSKQITNFDFVVTQILGFDQKGETVYVEATGNDPKGLQVYSVKLSNQKVIQITKDGGTHRTQLSDSGKYLIDNYSSLTTPRKIGIIDATSKSKDCNIILEAKNPLNKYAIGTTEFIKLKANDGTVLEARLIKPANFDATKKYPVLVYVYGGPHAQMVTDTWLGGASLWMHYLASEKDYLVFTLDNRGSAHRGFAFESSVHRNQGEVAMEDQITGVDYLKTLAYVDADRLAIHGWSYGGFMTISMLLHHPDVFTTGVAGGPVTDWKYYEVMYGERYMDTPQENPEGYAKTKVHNYIENLEGDLLIIHGSVDDVVVPQHSMTLLKDAVEKNVQIDFFTYPMHQHNVRGKDRVHLMQKVLNYVLINNK